MKQYTNTKWAKPPQRGGGKVMGRGGASGQRRNNSNPSNSSKFPRPNVPNHPPYNSHMRPSKPFINDPSRPMKPYGFKTTPGRKVLVTKMNGIVLEGLYQSTNLEQVILQNVSFISSSSDSKEDMPSDSSNYVIDFRDIASIEVDSSLDGTHESLKTDGDIARRNIQTGHGRTLQAPDAGWLQEPSNGVTFDTSEDTKHWDQFKTNEEKFGVKNTYDENLYTTRLDKNALSEEQIRHAEKTAKEIEGQVSSNPHVAEERGQKSDETENEENKYSSVARVPPPSYPPPQMAAEKPMGAPMNFAAALMKGQQPPPPPPPPPTKFQTRRIPPSQGLKPSAPQSFKSTLTPATAGSSTDATKDAGKETNEIKTPGKVPLAEKYKVSDVNFEAKKLRQQFEKTLRTPTKNWDAHQFTRNKMDSSKGKSREQQIAEFKNFSTSLEKKKTKDDIKPTAPPAVEAEKSVEPVKRQLNVNAKEFKPQPPPPPPMEAQQNGKPDGQPHAPSNSGKPHNQGQQHNQGPHGTTTRQTSSSNISVGSTPQVFPQMQPGMVPMPFPQFQPQQGFPMQVPVNMIHPMLLQQGPQGIQHVPIMHPGQNPQIGMMQNPHAQMMFPHMQGQPYFVQMMPQGPQMQQQFPGQPRVMFSGGPQQIQQQQPPEQNQKHQGQH